MVKRRPGDSRGDLMKTQGTGDRSHLDLNLVPGCQGIPQAFIASRPYVYLGFMGFLCRFFRGWQCGEYLEGNETCGPGGKQAATPLWRGTQRLVFRSPMPIRPFHSIEEA